MKKKGKNIVIAFILIMLLAISLSGCGRIKFSGTYVNEHDRKEKFKFSGESKVTYYNHGQQLKGTYFGDKESIIITFGQGEDMQMIVLMVESKKVLYYKMMAFVKKGYLERNWWKWLIAGAVYAAVEAIYKRKTGRNLGDEQLVRQVKLLYCRYGKNIEAVGKYAGQKAENTRINVLLDSIRNLMANMKPGAEQAMNVLEIEEHDREI